FPGDGVLQMRLAEADAGVEVERIEAALLGEYGFGNLDRGSMCHPIRRSDDEAVEGVAGIEWGALKTVNVGAPHCLCRPGRLHLHAPGLADQQLPGASLVACRRQACGLRRATVDKTRLAQRDVDALDACKLLCTALQQVVGVMRLDPILEELHRDGG